MSSSLFGSSSDWSSRTKYIEAPIHAIAAITCNQRISRLSQSVQYGSRKVASGHPRRQRSVAIATSSPSAVSSSSSVGLSMRTLQHLEDLGLRAPVDEDDEAESVPGLVLGVQARELGEHLGVDVGSLLGGRARREALRLPDRRVGVEHLALLLVGEHGDHLGRVLERIVALGEQLDEPRPPLEELGELLGAQLPR